MDGTALAYRAFYGIPALSTQAGQPTNALFGFVRLLRQLREAWTPDWMVVVFDGGTPRERLEKLPSYKAQRAPMPDDLRAQFPLINEFLATAHYPVLRLEAQEADDVMATLVAKAAPSIHILLATSDKDMFQLVNERTSIVSPTKSGEKMGPAEVQAKTGVPPVQVVEWQALTGDTVDNIPGVPGIGPKTAAKLLLEFGSLDNIWAGLERIASESLRAKLAQHRAVVERNLLLMRLRCDLEPMPALETLRAPASAPPELSAFFKKYELLSLVAEAGKAPRSVPAPAPAEQQGFFNFG